MKIFGASRSSVKVSGVAWKNVTSIYGISVSQFLYQEHPRAPVCKTLWKRKKKYEERERERKRASFLVSTGKTTKKKKKKIKNPQRSRDNGVSRKLVPTWRYCIEPTRPRISINNGKAALTTTTIRRLSFRASLPPSSPLPPVGRTALPPHGGVHT